MTKGLAFCARRPAGFVTSPLTLCTSDTTLSDQHQHGNGKAAELEGEGLRCTYKCSHILHAVSVCLCVW